ncbi:hypothetical protein [Nocardia sp. Marseille-Q1738]
MIDGPRNLDSLGGPHPPAAEGRERPGGEAGGTPSAAPHRDVSDHIAYIRDLAVRALAESFDADLPWGANGNWSACIGSRLGGDVGRYCAALPPDSLIVVLDSLCTIALDPCRFGSACVDAVGPSRGDWCGGCLARDALSALTPSVPETSAPGTEVAPSAASRDDAPAAEGAPNFP